MQDCQVQQRHRAAKLAATVLLRSLAAAVKTEQQRRRLVGLSTVWQSIEECPDAQQYRNGREII